MICYRDRTFCVANCSPKEKCDKQYTKKVQREADEWFGHGIGNAPIAFTNFNETCKFYKEKRLMIQSDWKLKGESK